MMTRGEAAQKTCLKRRRVAHALAISPRDNTLATGTRDGLVQLWNTGTVFERRVVLGAHGQRVWCLAWSQDGRLLASSAADGTIKLWNPVHSRESVSYPWAASPIRSLAVSPDGSRLLTIDDEVRLREWDGKLDGCCRCAPRFQMGRGTRLWAISRPSKRLRAAAPA